MTGKKTLQNIQNRTEQPWVYGAVILIMDFPKYSRAATLLYMPLIRPGDERKKL